MRLRRKSSAASWPFWLLIAAWFCANVPPTASVHVLVWLKAAPVAVHHTELRAEVASLLNGQPHTASPRLEAAAAAERTLPPATPIESVPLKKIFWHLAPAEPAMIARVAPNRPALAKVTAPMSPVRDVPHPPPRAAAKA